MQEVLYESVHMRIYGVVSKFCRSGGGKIWNSLRKSGRLEARQVQMTSQIPTFPSFSHPKASDPNPDTILLDLTSVFFRRASLTCDGPKYCIRPSKPFPIERIRLRKRISFDTYSPHGRLPR